MRFAFDVDIQADTPDEEASAERMRAEWRGMYESIEQEFAEAVHVDDCLARDVGRIIGDAILSSIQLCRRAKAVQA